MRQMSQAVLVAFLVAPFSCKSREVRLPDPPPPAAATPGSSEESAGERVTIERSESDGWWRVVRAGFTGRREFTEIVVFDPHAGALWPGAIVRTQSLSSGRLDPVLLPRSGGTVTIPRYEMAGATAGPSRHLGAPDPESYRGAYLELTNAHAAPPGASRVEVTTLHDPAQACARVGINAGWLAPDVKEALDAAAQSGKRTLLALAVGRTCTVVFLPDDAGKWFAAGVTQEQVDRAAGEGDPLAYIRSVTYGRAVLILAETDVEESAFKAALESFLSGREAEGDAHRKVLLSGRYTVLEYGRNAPGAAAGRGEPRTEGATGLIDTLRRTSAASSGAGLPLSFETRYLDGTTCAQTHAADWTETRTTPPAPYRAAIRLHYLKIEDTCESALDSAGDFVVGVRVDGEGGASWNRPRAGSRETVSSFGRGRHAVEQTVFVIESERRFVDLEIRFDELDANGSGDPSGVEVLSLTHVDLCPDEPSAAGNVEAPRPPGFIRDLSVVKRDAGGHDGATNTACLSLIRLDPE